MKRINRFFRHKRCLFSIILLPSAFYSFAAHADFVWTVSSDSGSLELASEDAGIVEIIEQLGERLGFDVSNQGDLQQRISGQYYADSVEEFVKLVNVDAIYIWNSNEKDRVLKEVILLSEGTENSQFLNDGKTSSPKNAGKTSNGSLLQKDQQQANEHNTGVTSGESAKSSAFGFSIDPVKGMVVPTGDANK